MKDGHQIIMESRHNPTCAAKNKIKASFLYLVIREHAGVQTLKTWMSWVIKILRDTRKVGSRKNRRFGFTLGKFDNVTR